MSMAHFSMTNPMVCIKVFCDFWFFCKKLHVVHLHGVWGINLFFSRFVTFIALSVYVTESYPLLLQRVIRKIHFPSWCLWGFSPLLTFFLPGYNSTFQFFMVSVRNLMNLSDILFLFRHYFHSGLRNHIIRLFVCNARHGYIFWPCFALFVNVLEETIQTIAFIRSARIFRKAMENWGNLLHSDSSEKPSSHDGVKN